MIKQAIVVGLAIVLLGGCASTPPPKSHNNVCSIYQHDSSWLKAARASEKRWGVPSYILMAFVHQESRFKHDAQPPRPYFLGVVPLPRKSSAYGYAQAQDPAWYDYQKATGRWSARRTNIHDALDFIGWYNYETHKQLGVARTDTYSLYLAYHEGRGGFKRKTYQNKAWLKNVAAKVANRAETYRVQQQGCRV